MNQIDRPLLRLLVALKHILKESKCVSDFLQNPCNSLSEAIGMIECYRQTLSELRCDERCQELWDEAEVLCSDLEVPERVQTRHRKLPTHLAEGGFIVESSSAESKREDGSSFGSFRQAVYSVIDRLLSELDRRFSEKNKKTMLGISALTVNTGN